MCYFCHKGKGTMPSVKREPMQLTEEELLVESDEDLEIGASLSVGLDDRNRMVVQLEYVYYDDHRRDNTLYALLDQEETTTLADRLHVSTAELPATLRKHFDDHPVLPPPSYVKGQFKEVLDFLIDCGARYRLYET